MKLLFERFPLVIEQDPTWADRVEDTRVFLLPENLATTDEWLDYDRKIPAIPFQTCFFDCINPKGSIITFGSSREEGEYYGTFRAVWIHEIGPGDYDYAIFSTSLIDGELVDMIWTRGELERRKEFNPEYGIFIHQQVDALISTTMEKILTLLNTHRSFPDGVRQVIKYKVNGKKQQYRLKQVIYIGGKQQKVFTTPSGKTIEYSHRWEVRGHWRKLSDGKVGKDRAGKYGIPGYTWVNDFEKGDKNAPLVSKIRVVQKND